MKIAMFTDAYWPRVNGVTVSVDAYSRALIRAGHQVVIVCSSYPQPEARQPVFTSPRENQAEPLIIYVPSFPLAISNEDRVAQFHKVFWVSKQLKNFNPEIVHINSEFVIAEFGFFYARNNRLPVVYTFHTFWEEYAVNYLPLIPSAILKPFVRKIQKNLFNRVHCIIAPTVQAEEVIRKYKINKEVFLLPTGIDPLFFNYNELQAADFRVNMEQMYPPLQDRRILIFAGRITKEKNIAFLLRILPAIVKKHPEIVLLIVGNGPELPELQKERERLGLTDHCVFTGYLEQNDLALAYAMSDIFVFPSLTETQGLVTIEAMSSGIPVVAIGSMGTITVMEGDKGGFMVKNDTEEFIARVFDLLEDSDLYYRKAEEAKSHAGNWAIDTMVRKLVEVYEKALLNFPPQGKGSK